MIKKSIFVLAGLSLIIGFAAFPVAAQVTTADVSGHVSDPNGLAVPDAKVTVSNKGTAFLREVKTKDSGDFSVPQIPPGHYTISIAKEGFETAVYGAELNVGDKRTLDSQLTLGSSSQTIEVTGAVPLIQTNSSEIEGSVIPIEISNLPVVDRNFAGLMTLVPGVRPAENFDPTKTRSGNVTVNGTDGRGIDYNVDGGDNKDNVIGGIVQNYTMEGIQEFNVVTDHYSADSGRAVGAVVNVISKSGTNQFHGTGFGLFQNNALNAKPFTAGSGPNPKYHRAQYGGSFGGPIKKDKLFFFGAFEQKREPGNIPVDASALTNFAILSQQSAPFSSWVHPTSQIPFPYIDDLVTIKVDWKISDRQSTYLRYGREKWTNPDDQLGNPAVADLSQTNSDSNQFHSMVLSHNYILGSNKTNTFSAQFQDFVNAISASPGAKFTYPVAGGGAATNPNICFGVSPGCGGGSPEIELGTNINVPQQTLIRKYQFRDDFNWIVGRNSMKFGVNYIDLAKLGGFFFAGANGYELTLFDTPQNILANPVIYPQGLSTPGTVEELTFNGGSGSTAQPPAKEVGLYYQDDLKVSRRLTLNLGLRWDAMPGFLVPQLTSNPDTTNRTIAVLKEVLASTAALGDPAAADGEARARYLAGDNSKLTKTNTGLTEFQPRMGFAWEPTDSDKLVIRGGYGIARDQIFQNLTLWSIQQSQPTIYQTIIDLKADNPGTSCMTGPLCSYVLGSPLPAPAPGITALAQGARGRLSDPNLTDAWAQQSSIGFAYQFSPDYALSVDYYHVLGTHEPRMIQDNPLLGELCDAGSFPTTANPADPRCVNGASTRLLDAAFADAGLETPDPTGAHTPRINEIRTASSTNRSHYDGIDINLQKRFSHNFTFRASDVISWSGSYGGEATSSYNGSNRDVLRQNEFLPSEYGPTQFDERNRLDMSGVFQFPHGFQLAPIFEWSTARPYTAYAGTDVNGDGQSVLDRACVGLGPEVNGCQMVVPNSFRGKALIQLDLSASKSFALGERVNLKIMAQMFNVFNRQNTCNVVNTTFYDSSGNPRTTAGFGQPVGYCGGQGYGATFGNAYRTQLGLRLEF